MDTNRIKKFATEARNILKKGVAARIQALGFNAKGEVPGNLMPQLVQGGSVWNGQLQTEAFYHQWMSLYRRVQKKGIKEVYEEAAYTWFNRLMAIRILQKNELCEPVMEYADEARTPRIVNEARMGSMPQMPEQVRQHLMELLDDDTKVTEQFAVLVTAWCHQNAIIQSCFGSIRDYTELLLPANILAEGGFVDMINHTEFIRDDDFKSAELIGWLYQFYISERKDEVFAKKGKFEADEIPAATQIFTPNWIVKYMVQNTVGRIYLDNNPWSADELKPKWKYLVEPSEPTPDDAIYRYGELKDLKVADLACGSGHILNECFDLLYDLYISEGYNRSEAIENIFRHNLTGVDIDRRARQMAQFALLIKACQRDVRFADAKCMPHVLSMPEQRESEKPLTEALHSFFAGEETEQMVAELKDCFDLMKDADSLGSIMKFDISSSTRLLVSQMVEYWDGRDNVPEEVAELMTAMRLILVLTEKYGALVMNPPYMGGGNMNTVLSKYVKKYYEIGKADLFSTFMLLAIDRLSDKGKYGMINMQSWMFLSSFERLREDLISNKQINSLLHLGPRTFDELGGEVVQNAAFVISNTLPTSNSIYYRLVDERCCSDKENLFIKNKDRNTIATNRVMYKGVFQNNFKQIPGMSLGYWLSSKAIYPFNNTHIGDISYSSPGIRTGRDSIFIRDWTEVSLKGICFNGRNYNSLWNYKWFPITRGGQRRQWYGNLNSIILGENGFERVQKECVDYRLRESEYYFKEGITWSMISSLKPSFRICNSGVLFGNGGPTLYMNCNSLNTIAFLNSKVAHIYLKLLNPTINTTKSDIENLPIVYGDNCVIRDFTSSNISISKQDWDAHETSWDFKENELISISKTTESNNDDGRYSLSSLYEQYKGKWKHLFDELHSNEEELNRQFIDIYGLQDELTPDVPLNEVTILQQGEITFSDDNTFSFNGDVIMKQLISYAIGVWMGRYRLDKPGLHIAHPEPTDEELKPYTYNGETVEIDDDGITPILPSSGCPFDDNLASRVSDFVRIAFGEDMLTENLNFMEKQLGKSIEDYLLKDFWKDHKKMYQNRPIYWLFSSAKGAFKCLAYMHRMTPYTAERVRAKYLLPYIESLNNRISELEARDSQLGTKERRQLDNLRKTLEECNEYHDRLQLLAEDTARTAFDLDDGVVVNYAKYGDVLAKIK